jgi:uncharacterized phage protein (TIGR02218 family)
VKTIPIALASHYAGKARSVALFLKLTRRADGEVFGWNSTDIPLELDSVTYAPGLEVTQIALAAGLGVNNLELTVLPDEDGGTVTRADLLTGVWDGSAFDLFEANYRSLGDGVNSLLSGINGEVTVNRGSFVVEMRGKLQFLNQPIGIVTSKTCRAILGDASCTVDLEPLTVTGTLTGVTSRQAVTDSARTEADEWYAEGTFTATSGANASPIHYSRRVKLYASDTFTFDQPFPYDFEVGDTYTAVVGCRKRLEDCRNKFDNVLNMQAEPHGRGIDVITATPETDQ